MRVLSSGRRIMSLRKPCEYSCARKKAHASPIFSHNTGLYITAYLSRGNFLTMAMYLKSGSGISQLAWALATPVNITADCKAVSNINFRMMYFIIAPVYVIKMGEYNNTYNILTRGHWTGSSGYREFFLFSTKNLSGFFPVLQSCSRIHSF